VNPSTQRRIAAQCLFFVLAALADRTVMAGTIYAGTCGTPNQPTIQQAVTASAACRSTLRICTNRRAYPWLRRSWSRTPET
jgi:hypothetical protein